MTDQIKSGETKKINSIQAINQAISQAMDADPMVLVLGEDVADREGGGVVGVTKGMFLKKTKT